MSAGTKIFLALFGLFVLLVVFYYGLWSPGSAEGELLMQTDAEQRDSDAERPRPAIDSPSADRTASNYSAGDRPQEPNRQSGTSDTRTTSAANDARSAGTSSATPPTNNRAATPEIEMGGVLPSDGLGMAANRPAIIDPTANGESTPRASANAAAEEKHVDLVPVAQYIVEEGDTLTGIAARWFGSADRWNLIVQLNPGLDPNRLQIGQRIKLPARDAGRATSTPARTTTATPTGTSNQSTTTLAPDEYTVQSGDSLARISSRMYGTEGLWEHIYRANQQTIGSDPHRLQVGMKLRIPPRP